MYVPGVPKRIGLPPLTPRGQAAYLRQFRAANPHLRNKAAQKKVARKLLTNTLALQHLTTIFQDDVPESFQDAVEIGLIYWRWAGAIVAKARREGTLHDLDAMFQAYDRLHKRSRQVPDGWKVFFRELWQEGFPVYWLMLIGEINARAVGSQRDGVSRVLTKLRDKLREKSAPSSE